MIVMQTKEATGAIAILFINAATCKSVGQRKKEREEGEMESRTSYHCQISFHPPFTQTLPENLLLTYRKKTELILKMSIKSFI